MKRLIFLLANVILVATFQMCSTDDNNFVPRTTQLAIQTEFNLPEDERTGEPARAYIIQGMDTLSEIDLTSKINAINFDGDPTETYRLVILKESFASYSRHFVPNELQNQLQGKPLCVVMQPALTMIAVTSPTNGYGFEFGFSTTDIHVVKTLTINWGDGVVENFNTYDFQYDYPLRHTYASYGKHFVSITGDIDVILSIGSFFHLGNKLNLGHLSELAYLSVTPGPVHLDLSHNSKLNTVEIGSPTLKSLNVSNNHELQYVGFDSFNLPTNFQAASLNKMISDIYSSVLSHNRQGLLILTTEWPAGEFFVQPSPQSIQKLRTLRDVYGWEIVPNP